MRIIAGQRRGKKLVFPDDLPVKPLTDRIKEAIFSRIHQKLPGTRVLDLYSGCGSFGLEAVSRGSVLAVCVERHKEVFKILTRNIVRTRFEDNVRPFNGDVFKYLARPVTEAHPFDLVFMDPPFADVENGTFFPKLIEYIPPLEGMTADNAILIIRVPTGSDIPDTLGSYVLDRSRKYGRSIVHQYERKK